MGWALPKQRAKTKFNEKQKAYLPKKFAEKVVQDMRTAKDKTGKRMFAGSVILLTLRSKKAARRDFRQRS